MELDLVRYFVKVVQFGSFSKAAESLKVPKSTVSKAISRLENETGTTLLLRTTRSQTLTPAGRAFFDSSVGAIQVLEDARKSLSAGDSIVSGVIKLTAPEDLGNHVVAPAIAHLAKRHAALDFELRYTDTVVDLVKDGFDLAIRIGQLKESRLKARRVGEITLIAVASPGYLKNSERIRHPRDLSAHACLTYGETSLRSKWHLKSKSESATVALRPRIMSNQMTSLMKMAVAGAGVALVPRYLCAKDVHSGRLVEVLPEWTSIGLPVSIVSPLAMSSTARLKITTDYLADAIRTALAE